NYQTNPCARRALPQDSHITVPSGFAAGRMQKITKRTQWPKVGKKRQPRCRISVSKNYQTKPSLGAQFKVSGSTFKVDPNPSGKTDGRKGGNDSRYVCYGKITKRTQGVSYRGMEFRL